MFDLYINILVINILSGVLTQPMNGVVFYIKNDLVLSMYERQIEKDLVDK